MMFNWWLSNGDACCQNMGSINGWTLIITTYKLEHGHYWCVSNLPLITRGPHLVVPSFCTSQPKPLMKHLYGKVIALRCASTGLVTWSRGQLWGSLIHLTYWTIINHYHLLKLNPAISCLITHHYQSFLAMTTRGSSLVIPQVRATKRRGEADHPRCALRAHLVTEVAAVAWDGGGKGVRKPITHWDEGYGIQLVVTTPWKNMRQSTSQPVFNTRENWKNDWNHQPGM